MASVQDRRVVSRYLQGAAGDTPSAYIRNPYGARARIVEVNILPRVTSAASGTNYTTGTLIHTDQAGATVVARSTAATALTKGTVLSLTLTGTGRTLEVDADESLEWDVTAAGSGVLFEYDLDVVFELVR